MTIEFVSSIEKSTPGEDNILKIRTGDKTIELKSLTDTFQSTTLTVGEGKNMHRFLIEFKERLDPGREMYYDFSTKQKLETAVAQLANEKENETTQTPPQATQPVQQPANKIPQKSIAQSEPNKLKDFLDKADNAYKAGDYANALKGYNEVLAINPRHEWSLVRKNTLEKILNEEANYNQLKARADNLFDVREYKLALAAYYDILNFRKDDPYATQRIDEINGMLLRQKAEETNLKLQMQKQAEEKRFNELTKTADSLFDIREYKLATSAYYNVLNFRKDDPHAKQRLLDINTKIKQQQDEQARLRLQMQKQAEEERFNGLTKTADDLFDVREYKAAITAYNNVLSFRKDNPHAKQRIAEINGILIQQAAEETALKLKLQKDAEEKKYNELTKTADDLFDMREYKAATTAYNNVLNFRANDAHAKQRLVDIIERLKQQQASELALQLQLQKEAEEKKYNELTKTADNLFDAWEYKAAITAYNNVLSFRKDDPHAKQRIAEINGILIQQAADAAALKLKLQKEAEEKKYTDLTKTADNLFDVREFKDAISAYTNVLNFRKDDLHAKQRIAEINAILAQQKAEAEKMKRDSIATAQSVNYIKQGDKYADAGNYAEALKQYQQAEKINPSSALAKQKISETTSNIKQISDEKKRKDSLDKVYTTAMKQGRAAFSDKKYPAAKKFFENAADAKTGDKDAMQWLVKTGNIIDSVTRENNYAFYISTADSIYNLKKDIATALTWYEKAAIEKPEERKPHLIIKTIRDTLAKRELTQKLNYEYSNALSVYNDAETARKDRRNKDAYSAYDQFLQKIDTLNTGLYSITQQAVITNAINNRRALYDFRPVAFTDVKEKYPGMDFSKPPTEQQWNRQRISYPKQPDFIKKEVLSLPPKVFAFESHGGLKFTCDVIKFKDANVYFRIVITNNDVNEFIAGPVILKRMKSGAQVGEPFLPGIIDNYPVVYPGNEQVMVFGIKELMGLSGETLVFEITERVTKKTCTLSVSGDRYEQQRSTNMQ